MKNILSIIIVIFLIIGCGSVSKSTNETENSKQYFNDKNAYVAISNFTILAEDDKYQFLSAEIPNDLAESFTKGNIIKPVERQELDKIIEELKLSMTGLTDENYSLQAGKLLGAKYILTGNMSKIENQIKISCRLIETETARIVYTESSRGLYSELFDVEEDLKMKIESYFK